jgi:hypothetical protein
MEIVSATKIFAHLIYRILSMSGTIFRSSRIKFGRPFLLNFALISLMLEAAHGQPGERT